MKLLRKRPIRDVVQTIFGRKENKKTSQERYIVYRSNVVQLDDMGYPLRLCIMSDYEQVWLDTYDEEGDVILKWEKVERKSNEKD